MLFVCVSTACALRCKCLVCPQGNHLFHVLCRTVFFIAISAMNVEPNYMFPVGSFVQVERFFLNFFCKNFQK